jgi:DegV family protein with EDD domain
MSPTAKRRVAVVTDSTAYLPPELVKKYDIHVVPQVLMLDGKTWRDGVDIDPPAFYELLRSSSSFPTTSQASRVDFQNLFTELSQQVEGIAAILVSADISGTVDSARAAAGNLPDVAVEILDSRGVSMKLGYPVLAAAQVATAGGDLPAVTEAARALIPKTRLYFVVETLEYLHRGGRIGGASRLIGSALNLKPVLEFWDGTVETVAKIRTRRKALDKVYDLIEEQIAGKQNVHMAVLDVASPQEAAEFIEQLTAHFQPVEMLKVECSPVVGAHAGPGTVGVAFYAD